MIERRHVAHIGHAARLSLAVVLTVAIAACSGGDDAGSTTTADSTAPTGVSTSDAPVTTEPTTTSSTAATTPSTTEAITTPSDPTTTPPPSSTAPPSTTEADVIAEVTAAMNDYYDFYWACLRAPEQCDPADVAVPASDAFAALSRTRDDLLSGGFFVGAEPEGYMVVEAVEPLDGFVLAHTCWWSTAVLYGPPAPDGTPVVQNDNHGSSREDYQMVRDAAGNWKVRRGDTITRTAGVNECPAEA